MRRSDLIRFELDYGDIDDNNGEDGKMLLLMMVSARSLIKLKLKYLLLLTLTLCLLIFSVFYTLLFLYSSSKRVFSSLFPSLFNLLGCFTHSLQDLLVLIYHTCGAFLHNKLLSRHISLFT